MFLHCRSVRNFRIYQDNPEIPNGAFAFFCVCSCEGFLRSSASIHILDGSEIRPVRRPLRSGYHRVPIGALPLPGSHAADVTTEQETGSGPAALLRSSCWHRFTG